MSVNMFLLLIMFGGYRLGFGQKEEASLLGGMSVPGWSN